MKGKKKARKARSAPAGGGDPGGTGPVCPHCRHEITWENLGTSETEISIYVREKMYFCPGCRAIVGVASWHTEG
ncbi:MAG TPA: hypothetical protein VFC90_11180 [Planctomycetota bacterium]|nr:hypothetical protein [Planctomycetota bacterium]